MKIYSSALLIALFTGVFISTAFRAEAAEVYYLGGSGQGIGAQANPSYSFKQRFSDLLDLSKDNKERSGRISGSLSEQFIRNDVSGNTSKSFLRRGNVYVSEANLNLMEKLGGNYHLESQVFLRQTDDLRIDPRKDVRMKQFNLKIMDPDNLYEFGDFYGDLSQFTLSSSLEGAHAVVTPSPSQKYQVVAARVGEADQAAGKFQRNVGALKADHYFFMDSKTFSNFRMGLQAVTVADDSSTVERTASTQDINNTVLSTDGEIALRGPLSLQYELASSFYKDETASDPHHTDKANAFRLAPALNFSNWSTRYLYYLVQPKFYTDQGSASPDKEQHQLSVDYRFSKRLSVNVMENYYWDHLPGSSRTMRTTNNEQYVTITGQPFEERPSFVLRPYVSYARKDSDDLGNTAEGATRTAGIGFNDLLQPIGLNYGAKYEFRSYKDYANNTSSDYIHRIGFNFSKDMQLWQRRLYLALEPNIDLRRTKSNSGKYDVGTGLGVNGQYDISKRLVLRGNHTLSDMNSAKTSADYFQTRTSGELDFTLNAARTAHFITRYEYNHYIYEDGQQSYNENRIIGKFFINF